MNSSKLAIALLSVVLVWPAPLSAQEGGGEAEEALETDRDSFTPATTTAGARRLIVESAYSFIDNRAGSEGHSYPELLLRGGLGEFLELRLGWNIEVSGGGAVTGADSGGEEDEETAGIERERKVSYGLKARLFEQQGFRPASAVIMQASTPTSGPGTATGLIGTSVFGWTIGERYKLDAAMRYGLASEEGDHFNAWAPSVVLRRNVGERFNLHGEYFADFSEGRAAEFSKHFFSPGVHCTVTSNLELGVRVGWGLNDQSPHFFSNAGVGWRY